MSPGRDSVFPDTDVCEVCDVRKPLDELVSLYMGGWACIEHLADGTVLKDLFESDEAAP